MTHLILTRDQVRAIDRRAVEEYDMPGIILMENAGRNAAEIINEHFARLPHKRLAVFAGPGNNGGDGFVIARHLHNAAWDVRVVLTAEEDKLKGDALTNYTIVKHMPIPMEPNSAADGVLDWAEVVLDALLGTGFSGEVRPPLDMIIEKINRAGKPVVAVDVPSGLDCQTGRPARSTIKAALTITFVAVKSGLVTDSAKPYVGMVVAADIGVPKELVRRIAAENRP